MPHGIVSENGKSQRLDDLGNGMKFTLLVNGLPHDSMTHSVTAAIDRLGAVVVPFSDARFADTEGRITALFETTGAKTILVRPDFYAFGSAASAEEAEAMLIKAAAHFDLSGVETAA